MVRHTELDYLNERIRAEQAIASKARLPMAAAIHAELAARYRKRRHEKQVEPGIKLRRRYPIRLWPADWMRHRRASLYVT